MIGIQIFNGVQDHSAQATSSSRRSEGFLHARTRTPAGFAIALVHVKETLR